MTPNTNPEARLMNKGFLGLIIVLAITAMAITARAQTLNASGIARLNQDAQALWTTDGLTMAHDAALKAANTLVGVPHLVDSTTNSYATIIGINSITLDCPGAPGVTRLDGGGVTVGVPLSGAWHINVVARMNLHGTIFWTDYSDTFNVTIDLSNIKGDISIAIDSSNPAAPRVTAVNAPHLSFTLNVSSTNEVVNAIGWIGSNTVNAISGTAVTIAAQYLAQKLGVMASSTPTVIGAGGPGLAPITVDAAQLQNSALTLGDEIEAYRTPFGPIIEQHFDTAYSGTWLDSLTNPHFTPGTATFPHAYGDSGEMTGQYLASLAFQYATTKNPTTKARGLRMLNVLRTLLTMRHDAGIGELGSMNRSIMPLSYLTPDQRPPTTYTSGNDYAAMYNGQLYSFTDYQSRDEYLGLFYGLSIAYDLFDDPAMKANAQTSIEMALDYLLAHGWTWRRKDGSLGEHWQGSLDQQYAWILAGYHGNPAKYQAAHDQYKGFTDILWVGYWIAVMDPYYQYYKFQLGSGSIYTLLRLETDPAAWQRAYQAVAIQRNYIGHHLNPHFNNVYMAFDSSSKARLGAENANLLTRWLHALRRRTRVDISNDPTIPTMDYTPPVNTTALPGSGPAPTIKISKYPLTPEVRIGQGFLWSCSPFELNPGYPAGPDAYIEGETLDFVLPYWQSRYMGVVPAPRTINPGTGTTVATTISSPN
jgi:hypothetical protein